MKAAYIPGIDGLRALAVLAVMAFHLDASLLPGGFMGVDIFFVISGYVVTRSLTGQWTPRLRPYLLGFYARRVTRIYPALLVCLVVTACMQAIWVPAAWLNASADKTALAAILGAGNLALVWFNDGYFSPRVEFNAFTHTWSLGVEEQFYLLFPFTCWAWGFAGPGKVARRRWAMVGLVGTMLASLALATYQTRHDPTSAYYLLPSRFWELAGGALLSWAHERGRLLPGRAAMRAACALAGLALLTGCLTQGAGSGFPMPWALAPVAGSLLLLAALAGEAPQAGWSTAWLQGAVMTTVGQLSYALYLWHWPVLVMFRWTTGLEHASVKVLAVVLTGVLAAASTYGLEQRLKRLVARRQARDARVVGVGAVAACCCLLICAALFKLQPLMTASVTGHRHDWYSDAPRHFNPTRLEPAAAPGTRTLFVLGDSHAGAYGTLLNQLADEQRMRVLVWSKAGCPIANLIQAATGPCQVFTDQVLRRIEAWASPGDLVLLASLRMNRLGDQWAVVPESQLMALQDSLAAQQARNQALAEAQAIVARLEQKGLRVIIDAPKPVFKAPAFRCADWFNRSNPVCRPGLQMDRTWLQAWRQPAMQALATLQASHPTLLTWDAFDALCPLATCEALVDGKPLFFDGDHLSAHANRLLYPGFLALVTAHKPPAGQGPMEAR